MATTKKTTAKKAQPNDQRPDEGVIKDAAPAPEADTAASTPNTQEPGAVAAQLPPSPAGGGAGGEGFVAAPADHTITHLDITADRESFWRAGRRWSNMTQRVAVADLTDAQIEALYAEPALTVVGVAE